MVIILTIALGGAPLTPDSPSTVTSALCVTAVP